MPLRPSLTRGRNTFTYYPGAVRVPEGAAPDMKSRSFTVTAEVEIPKSGAEGVLATQGGRFGGWGLLLISGKPEFDYAFSNQQQHKYRVVSNEKLAAGIHTLKFDFQYDGPGYGKGGTGTPVIESYVNKMPFKFTRELKKVVIELGKSERPDGQR